MGSVLVRWSDSAAWSADTDATANHQAIFKNVGIEPVDYPYYDPKTVGLDFEGFKSSLEKAEDGSAFLIHGCAHNVSRTRLACLSIGQRC